jgi:hypothetical protein
MKFSLLHTILYWNYYGNIYAKEEEEECENEESKYRELKRTIKS